jgi:hypothetical protein
MIAQLYKDACGKKEYMSKTRSFALFFVFIFVYADWLHRSSSLAWVR